MFIDLEIDKSSVHFRLRDRYAFFANHDNDKVAARVNSAVELFIITLGKGTIFW